MHTRTSHMHAQIRSHVSACVRAVDVHAHGEIRSADCRGIGRCAAGPLGPSLVPLVAVSSAVCCSCFIALSPFVVPVSSASSLCVCVHPSEWRHQVHSLEICPRAASPLPCGVSHWQPWSQRSAVQYSAVQRRHQCGRGASKTLTERGMTTTTTMRGRNGGRGTDRVRKEKKKESGSGDKARRRLRRTMQVTQWQRRGLVQ